MLHKYIYLCSIPSQHTLGNFLYKHSRYVHPDFALKEGNRVTLQGITTTHAFFCISDEGEDVYVTKIAPFVFLQQFLAAK